MSELLVSAIVPVFAGERFVERALDSIAAQTHPCGETIVIDDGSPDRSAELAAARPGVHVLRQPNAGVAAARNAGIAVARGDVLAFLDQDDEWLPEKLACQVAVLRQHPDVGIVLSHVERVVTAGTTPPEWFDPAWLDRPHAGHLPSTWLVRSETFQRVGHFDGSYVTGCDADWLARARDAGVKSVMLTEVLVRWWAHGANASYDRETMRGEALRVLRDTARRKRRAAHAP